MNRKGSDLLKTVGAIVVIGGIVVATFLYGNRQRQEQVRRDLAIRQQQEQKAAKDNGPKVSVDDSKDKAMVKPENQTAPKAATPPTAPATTATAPTPPAATATTPTTPGNVGGGQLAAGGGTDTTPKTGGEMFYLLPAGLILALYKVNRSSRNWVRSATLKN